MKVFINARFLTQITTGVQRYAIEVVRALDGLIESGLTPSEWMSFCMIAPRRIRHDLELRNIPLKRVGHLSGHLWEQLELPFYARHGVLVSFANASPLATRDQIVTIHDAAVFAIPGAYSFTFRTWYRLLLRGLGRRARRIMTDSSFSRDQLARYCEMPEAKICVNYPGGEHILRVPAEHGIIDRGGLRSGRFVLAVGSLSMNKNVRGIMHALRYMGERDFDLVIAGGANPKVFGLSDVQWQGGVKHLGYVNDGELRALYEHAACFVYPSFYEGFGLPPVEAMACGCPVIVSRAGALPEVCGSAALYCDPWSPRDIAAKVVQVMTDPGLRRALRDNGLRRAQEFTWRACAGRVVALVEDLLERSAPVRDVAIRR